jgi:hypothetical protein
MAWTEVPEDWTQRLASAVSLTVREFGGRVRGTPVVRLAVDCHPRNGFLGLALLTSEEVDADALLVSPAEMAAWRYYSFSDGLASWHPAGELGREMREAYAVVGDWKATADAFLKACALAVASAETMGVMEWLDRDGRFQVIVPHPDDGREFYPPGA